MASGSSSDNNALGKHNDSDATFDRVAASISDSDSIEDLVTAIIYRREGESSLVDRVKGLTESQVRQIKLCRVHKGKLTVFGHVCVTTESYSDELLRLLFTKASVNFSEEFDDNHWIPLLHLAAYCGNVAAVKVLLEWELMVGIDFCGVDNKFHTVLHMAVKSRDLTIVAIILSKCYDAHPEWFGDFLNYEDALGLTALQHAAWEGHEHIIKELLQYDEIIVNEGGEHGFTALHLASWNGHVEVVKLLVEKMDRDIGLNVPTTESLYWISGGSSLAPRSREWTKNSLARRLYFQESHLVSFSDHRQTVLNLEKAQQRIQWSRNRDYGTKFLSLSLDVAKMRGLTALHCAAYNGQTAIVKTVMDEIEHGLRLKSILNPVDGLGLTPLHYAVVAGDPATVEMLFNYKGVRGDVKDTRSLSLTPLTMAHRLKEGFQKVDMENIAALLLEQSDVKAFIDKMYKDRQLFVDAANAILVGAALIASITFAGWLQPPLNYQQYYGADYLVTGAAPPDTYASYAAVRHHLGVVMFWIFNSLSFFFAIATVLLGACVVLPVLGNEDLDKCVSRMRRVHIWTTLALIISVCFVLGAFIAAGFAVLPPTLKYQLNMIVTTMVGGSFAFCALWYYTHRVFISIGTLKTESWEVDTSLKLADMLVNKLGLTMIDRDNRRKGYGRRPNPHPSVTQLNRSVWKLYSPPEGVTFEMDIVFFHGLQVDGDYENAFWKAWVAEEDHEVIWPMDWLSLHLPTARMFSVSYSSSATLPLSVLGENLVTDIILDQSSGIGQTCPLFLVGHSLGGVAIKQFILSALEARDLVGPTPRDTMRYESFFKNLKGAFFYALPHSDTQIARFASRQKESPILSLMKEIDRETDNVNAKFTLDGRTQMPFVAIKCQSTFLPGSIASGSSGRFENEIYTYPEADHFSVCQARDPNDPIVIEELVNFISNRYDILE